LLIAGLRFNEQPVRPGLCGGGESTVAADFHSDKSDKDMAGPNGSATKNE